MSTPQVYVCDDVRAVMDLHRSVFDEDFPKLAVRESAASLTRQGFNCGCMVNWRRREAGPP